VSSQGKAQLSIEGQRVDVKTHVPLTQGETLILKAVRNGDVQVLKLVEAHNPVDLPPGFSEMRSLGKDGLYKDLENLLNNHRAAPRQPGQTRAGSMQAGTLPGGGTPELGPDGRIIKTAPGETASQTARASSTHPHIQTIRDSPVPTEIKLTLGLKRLKQEGSFPSLPARSLETLGARLEALTREMGLAGKTQPLSPSPTLESLTDRAQKLLDTFSTGIKSSLTRSLNLPDLPAKEVLYNLLTSENAQATREKGMVELRSRLIKTFFARPQAMVQTSPTPTALASALQTLPSTSGTVPFESQSVFGKLHELVDALALKPGETYNENTLRDLVKGSGLLWENKLRSFAESLDPKEGPQAARERAARLLADDIKGLSMKISEPSDHSPKDIAESLKRFVDHLEKMQVLNKHGSEEAGRFLLPLPFFSGETLRFGQLFVDLDRKKPSGSHEGDRMVRVAFLLEMSRLGHIQADFAVFRKSVGGEFLVETPSAKEDIDRAMPDFLEALKIKGFSVTRMECRVSDPETLSQTSLAERMVAMDDGTLNILI
jgi:hypothetical protein